MDLDLEFVRSRFPGLAGDWIFFDNAGGSQTLEPVTRRIVEYLHGSDVQHGASYAVSRLAEERVAAGVAAVTGYLGAPSPGSVIMGPSSSMLLRIISESLARTLRPGDEIIVTNCDHEANIGPWLSLAEHGATIKTWRLDPDSLSLQAEDLEKLLTERTRLVAFTHCSNLLGGINPVRQFADLIHAAGALVCVDGVAYAPHRNIDVEALDVDLYVFSAYKVYGPHVAALYGREELLRELPGTNHFFIDESDVPYKFQPGGPNYELCYGMLGLADYFAEFAEAHGRRDIAGSVPESATFATELIAAHEENLAGRLLDFLETKSKVRVIGPSTADRALRVPT
ncbi:MAG: aminotransferase class V-fold PLP-dependent enzyme, partial [bacterium]|nr:aminotransferase class V-fold PLP-dependent enzyme [bacterium]